MTSSITVFLKLYAAREELKRAFGDGYASLVAKHTTLLRHVAKGMDRDYIGTAHQLIMDLKAGFPDWEERDNIQLDIRLILAAAVDLTLDEAALEVGVA